MRALKLFAPLTWLLLVSSPAWAQVTSLIADNVDIRNDVSVVASGNVQVVFGDTTLTAHSITYNSTTDTIQIVGPITLSIGDDTVIFADAAMLDGDLQNGILSSARLVLDQQLQLAAAEINRVSGRYTQLYKTVASSCQVCGKRSVPLWQIRAEKVVHDQQEQQLYFENAQFRIVGVPVFFIPRLRMPDPSLERATGFLLPLYNSSSTLGVGIKIPYFIALGDSADITITPFISAKTRTLEARYRQAFRTGEVQFDGAATDDDLEPGKGRAYLFGQGSFNLPRDYELKFDLELTSDSAYLLDYGYSGKDRLDSQIAITRTDAETYVNAALIHFETLRGSELAIDDQLPNFQGELTYQKRFFPHSIGGQGSWTVALDAHNRASQDDIVGRDVVRFGVGANWSRTHIFDGGLIGRLGGEIVGDVYQIAHDSTYDDTLATGSAALEAQFGWPLVKSTPDGTALVLEPVVHLSWANSGGATVPNEDSTLVEFDEGNLFALSHFPGQDRYENGLRATLGVTWSRFDPSGSSMRLAFGRVFRESAGDQFSRASGLDGTRSDWLAAGQIKLADRLSLTGRTLFTDALTLTKAESQILWNTNRWTLGAKFAWIVADLDENRPDLTAQTTFDASYQINRHWMSQIDWRYDHASDDLTRAGLGLIYSNECASVDLSLSRRFTSSTNVTPATEFGISVALRGFGSGRGGPARSCSG